MITVTVKECNTISQDFYDTVINSLQFHQLTCTCGHSGCLTIHAYYSRKVKLPDGSSIRLRILRVKCSECGRTHAILLSSLVPCSQISLSIHLTITQAYEDSQNPLVACTDSGSIDENHVKRIIRTYLCHWKERLLSARITLSSIGDLVCGCFSFYSAQFMQIRRTPNTLFAIPT